MKAIAALVISSLALLNLTGQEIMDSIHISKTVSGTVFQLNGKNLMTNQLIDITKSNPEAYSVMKIARTNYNVCMTLIFASGILLYYSWASAIYIDIPDWTPAAIGAGLVAVSIPFGISYTNHVKKAVKIYNDNLKYSSVGNPVMLLGTTGNGIGLNIVLIVNRIYRNYK